MTYDSVQALQDAKNALAELRASTYYAKAKSLPNWSNTHIYNCEQDLLKTIDHLTTVPVPTGQILNFVDYETGNENQWTWGVQDSREIPDNVQYHRGTLKAQSTIVGAGGYAGRVDLPAYATGNRAAEGIRKRSIDIGKTDWFSIMFLFPSSGWKDPQGWGQGVILQLNYMSMHSPAFSLGAGLDFINCVMLGGKVTDNPLSYEYNKKYVIVPPPMKLDAWHEFVIGVKWATDWTGFVEIYHKLKGETNWAQVLNVHDVPTEQWGMSDGKNVTKEGIDVNTGQPYVTADKAGCYAGQGVNPLVMYHDQFFVGTSKEIVMSKMP